MDSEIITYIICDYLLTDDVINYLNYINKLDDYEYLYILYDAQYIKRNCKKIRHVYNIKNTDELKNIPNIISIVFHSKYNTQIKPLILPQSLQSITFGWCYDQIIHPNILPQSLQSITFDCDYKHIKLIQKYYPLLKIIIKN